MVALTPDSPVPLRVVVRPMRVLQPAVLMESVVLEELQRVLSARGTQSI